MTRSATPEFCALVPELIVSDIRASLAFWCDVIGFAIWYERPQERFAFLCLGQAQIMLEQRSESGDDWVADVLERPFGRGLNFQLQVPDLDALLVRCEQRGIALFLPLEERWYRRDTQQVGQRQCIVADPDGYLVRCVQPLGVVDAMPAPPGT